MFNTYSLLLLFFFGKKLITIFTEISLFTIPIYLFAHLRFFLSFLFCGQIYYAVLKHSDLSEFKIL